MTHPIPPTRDGGATTGWRWKPVDIAILVIAFIAWWPAGLAFLAWKIWNDRQPVPTDLGQALQAGVERLQAAFDGLVGSFNAPVAPARSGPPPVTGNAAFDAHVRAEWSRMEADRRALEDEIEAFRAHLASERADDTEVYERFRAARASRP
jgi:hypothetical protein